MPIPVELDKMNVQEKLELLENVWADLCRNEENIPVPQWHKDILDEREKLVQEGKLKFSSWQSAKERIFKRTS
jgi:hypothetical protein